mmetsp:Transcript_23348/g.66935  ORF Transcript_23348/g.66935 Transcript_23348/m.66935 type:complete len:230 (+) Transcript_23348:392-1081(+)
MAEVWAHEWLALRTHSLLSSSIKSGGPRSRCTSAQIFPQLLPGVPVWDSRKDGCTGACADVSAACKADLEADGERMTVASSIDLLPPKTPAPTLAALRDDAILGKAITGVCTKCGLLLLGSTWCCPLARARSPALIKSMYKSKGTAVSLSTETTSSSSSSLPTHSTKPLCAGLPHSDKTMWAAAIHRPRPPRAVRASPELPHAGARQGTRAPGSRPVGRWAKTGSTACA